MKKKTLRALPAFVAASFAVSAFAQTSTHEYTLQIERQPIADALTELSKQTGLQIGYVRDAATETIFVGPLNGRYTTEAAMTKLLVASGLSFERLNERTIAVSRSVSRESERRGVPTTELRTESAREQSFMRLAEVRLAEVPAVGDAPQSRATGTPASAQEADAGTQRRSRTMEEVIVTAQKRTERLQDVPISISVFKGEDLDRSTVQGTTEMLNRAPGVAATVSALGTPKLAIRGVTASNLAFAGSSPIAYYIDSMPFGFVKSAFVPDVNVYDLARMEVLRGPQGTLYGANAQNGVVRVLTNDANPDASAFKARTSVSSTEGGAENYRADMALNVPLISEKLAVRAVVGYQDLSGWIDKPNDVDANDAELVNGRVKINARPTDELSIGLSAWLSRSDLGSQSISDDDARNGSLGREPVTSDYDAYGLTINYDFPGVSLSSVTSYLDYTNESVLDLVPFFFNTLQRTVFDSEVLSQEVTLSSTHEGAWRWSLGGMYRDGEDRRRHRLLSFPQFAPTDYGDLSKSYAVFGELTRAFSDGRFELTGGLRYFSDDATARENYSTTLPLIRRTSTFDAVSPRVALTWHPQQDVTVYASYSEGFRSGFPQAPDIVRAAPQFPAVDADTLKNYEVGGKASLWGGRFVFDTALFYIDWRDMQQSLAVLVDGFPRTVNINTGSASGLGFEVAATISPVKELELGISVGWNDLAVDEVVRTFPAGSPPEGVILFDKGDRLVDSPELTLGASADYVFPLGRNGFQGRFSASANYTSKREINAVFTGIRRSTAGEPILIAGTSFSINSPSHWTATLFVDNVNNEQDPVTQDFLVPFWDSHVRPRTIGLQFEYSY